MNGALRKGLALPLGGASAAAYGLSSLLNFAGAGIGWLKVRHVDYVARPDDIFLVTYPRSGTTWLQMILYQLTTDGEMGFVHISERVPWFERMAFNGRSVLAVRPPRVFKTHLPYRTIPKGRGRYVYFCRDPRDVAVSYYHFYRNHLPQHRWDFETFFEHFIRGRVQFGAWARHVAGWWARRDDPSVLFLWYEDAQDDLEGCIRTIAEFCGISIDEERLPTILERCSFEFMKRFEERFDHAYELLWEQGMTVATPFGEDASAGEDETRLDRDQRRRLDEALRRRTGMSIAELMRGSTREPVPCV